MPRRPRVALAGVPLHLIQRGHNRDACFFTEEDYALYLDHLAELSARFGCCVHAYVLMPNHVHLLLTPARADGASQLMKQLSQRYVQYINRAYQRSGTLWEGRFRSCIAQAEDYVLACHRYLELNPVRARMVTHPRHYRWSSYRTNAEGKASDLVAPHAQYLALGRTHASRREAYRALFRDDLDPSVVQDIRDATNGNFALGNARFLKRAETILGRRVSRGRPGRPPNTRPESQ